MPQKWVENQTPEHVPCCHVSACLRCVPVPFLPGTKSMWGPCGSTGNFLPALRRFWLWFRKKDLTPTPNLLRILPIPPLLGHILSIFGWNVLEADNWVVMAILWWRSDDYPDLAGTGSTLFSGGLFWRHPIWWWQTDYFTDSRLSKIWRELAPHYFPADCFRIDFF